MTQLDFDSKYVLKKFPGTIDVVTLAQISASENTALYENPYRSYLRPFVLRNN